MQKRDGDETAMIARLTGQIIDQKSNELILDIHGVGYLVTVSMSTLNEIQEISGNISLLIEMIVREDSITLYGFLTQEEKFAFNLLQAVQGVGAKAALSILSTLAPEELKEAILSSDKAMVSRADGIGPKLAQRIINELSEKVGKLPISLANSKNVKAIPDIRNQSETAQDALSALTNLGYSHSEAWIAVQKASARSDAHNLEQLLNNALKEIGQK